MYCLIIVILCVFFTRAHSLSLFLRAGAFDEQQLALSTASLADSARLYTAQQERWAYTDAPTVNVFSTAAPQSFHQYPLLSSRPPPSVHSTSPSPHLSRAIVSPLSSGAAAVLARSNTSSAASRYIAFSEYYTFIFCLLINIFYLLVFFFFLYRRFIAFTQIKLLSNAYERSIRDMLDKFNSPCSLSCLPSHTTY